MKKIIIGCIVCLLFPFSVYAANFSEMAPASSIGVKICTQATPPASIIQSTPGNIEWTAPANVASEDGQEASVDSHSTNAIRDTAVRLISSDGTIFGVDKSNSADWTETLQYIPYGGDTWKTTLTPAGVNNPNFGFAIQVSGGIANSNFLKVSHFGFQIPSSATITSVTAEVKRREAQGANGMTGYIDHIRMSVCYTSTGAKSTIPFVLETVGDVKNIRVAPGGILTIPMTLQAANGGNFSGIMIRYQILSGEHTVVDETDTVNDLSIATLPKAIHIPANLLPGTYDAAAMLLVSADQTGPELVRFRFTIERKIAGMFASQFIIGMCTLGIIIGMIALYIVVLKRKKSGYDYSDIPEPDRKYYEMIGDMISQMHGSIGDLAYKMAGSITGMSVDKATGRITKMTKDPSEVLSVLYIKYENVFKRKLKISARTKKKNEEDSAAVLTKELDTFEKYFRKK
jgi:hypothetical protein